MAKKAFEAILKQKSKELENTINRRLPILIGRKATDFYKDSFRQGGFVNNGLRPWPETQRQRTGGKRTAARYGPLMSERKNLYGSIRYVPGEARVTVGTSVAYAEIHNQGGTVTSHPTVTPKMRRFAWRQFFEAGGEKTPMAPEAAKWKALALTKKKKLDVTAHIPKRQFIGTSKELDNAIRLTIDKEFTNILKK